MKLAELPLLTPHIGKPAILDANVLLFYWCAQFDPSLVGSFKRLNSFGYNDIHLLNETLRIFRSLSTTPHVLTETSNLANSLQSWAKEAWADFLSRQISSVPEIYTPAYEVASDIAALYFGITDAALARIASEYVILTIDWPLTNLLESRRLRVINFNHIREAVLF